MNCAQVKEQLVDFLYDELSPTARTAFAEHLRGCPGCSAEVASHERTLGQARAALGGPLQQEPPPRVHAAILAAAKLAASESARERAAKESPGILARFWRTPWLLPAFGAVSVATVVFLVRVLKNPEVIPGQHPRSLDERAVVTPLPSAPQPSPEPTAAPTPAAAAAEGAKPEEAAASLGGVVKGGGHGARRAAGKSGAKPEAPDFERARPKKGLDLDAPLGGLRGSGTTDGTGRFAEPPPPRPAATKSSRSLDDLLGEVGRARKPAAAPAEGSPEVSERKAPARDNDELADYGRPPTVAKPAAKKAKAAEAISEPTSRPSGFTPQPAPMAAPASAPAPSPPPMPAAASAPARAAVPTSKAAHRQEMGDDMAPDEDAAEPTEKQLAKDKAPAVKGGPALDESVKKADRLFASQDWTAAATAYRDLLNRYPTHKDAPKWRARMNQSLVAVEEARKSSDAKAGKAAKAKSTDTLLKGMK